MYAPRQRGVQSAATNRPCHPAKLYGRIAQNVSPSGLISGDIQGVLRIIPLFEHSGHSGRETPVPISNTADKPSRVPYCTEVREPLGTLDRCYAHLLLILVMVRLSVYTSFLKKTFSHGKMASCHQTVHITRSYHGSN